MPTLIGPQSTITITPWRMSATIVAYTLPPLSGLLPFFEKILNPSMEHITTMVRDEYILLRKNSIIIRKFAPHITPSITNHTNGQPCSLTFGSVVSQNKNKSTWTISSSVPFLCRPLSIRITGPSHDFQWSQFTHLSSAIIHAETYYRLQWWASLKVNSTSPLTFRRSNYALSITEILMFPELIQNLLTSKNINMPTISPRPCP